MRIAEKIQIIKKRSEEISIEAFGADIVEPQVVENHASEIHEVTDLFGRLVQTPSQLKEFLFEVNGGANIKFAQHWLSAEEMAEPFGKNAEYLQVFDPLSPLENVKASFFECLENEIYAYQEAMAVTATGTLNNYERLVLLGYNLIELGTRPTYLFFRKDMLEPMVWSSAVDWIQVYENLDSFLDIFLE